MPQMLDQRPYLLRSFQEWISDSDLTPHIMVDCSHPGVFVPAAYIQPDNTIILNTAYDATSDLIIGNEIITFSCRFSGKVEMIEVPINAVQGIFCKENGAGARFEPIEQEPESPVAPETSKSTSNKPPFLKVVK